MKPILVLFSVGFLFSCSTTTNPTENNPVQSDATKAQLNSKVKQLNTWNYNINANNQLVLEDGQKVRYNQSGNIESMLDYNAKKELINTCNYRYNKQQDCISKTCTSSNTQSTEIYSYQEGKKHTCTEIVQGDTVRKVLYSYNKLGKLHKIYEQYQTADVKTSTHYLYDKKGNNSERLIYDQSGQLNLKYLYQYDSLGRNIKQSIMTSDGILGYAVSLGYNEQGNIATRSNFSGPKTSPLRVDYTYEYDKQKNWLVQNTQSAAGILQKKTKREIVYY